MSQNENILDRAIKPSDGPIQLQNKKAQQDQPQNVQDSEDQQLGSEEQQQQQEESENQQPSKEPSQKSKEHGNQQLIKKEQPQPKKSEEPVEQRNNIQEEKAVSTRDQEKAVSEVTGEPSSTAQQAKKEEQPADATTRAATSTTLERANSQISAEPSSTAQSAKKEEQPAETATATTDLYKQRAEQGKAKKQQGNRAFKEGDYTNAIVHYMRASELLDLRYYSYSNEQLFNQVLKENITLLNNSAMAYLKLGQPAYAVAMSLEVLKLSPSLKNPAHRKARMRLASAYKMMGKIDEAYQCVSQLVKQGLYDQQKAIYLQIKQLYQAEARKRDEESKKTFSNMFSERKQPPSRPVSASSSTRKKAPQQSKASSWLDIPILGIFGGLLGAGITYGLGFKEKKSIALGVGIGAAALSVMQIRQKLFSQ